MRKETVSIGESEKWIETVLDSQIALKEKIDRGGNNRIFKIETERGGEFVFKSYFVDDRNRLEREYSALEFLEKEGIACVPKAIAKNENQGCALYTFVDGTAKNPGVIDEHDAGQMVDFVIQLQSINPRPEEFPTAVLATDSFDSFSETIMFRVNKFLKHINSVEQTEIVRRFYKDFKPHELIVSQIQKIRGENLEMFNCRINDLKKRLSPVDFGPHNMLFLDKTVNFIDFEYFGWDDPVKIIPNLIFHEGSSGMTEEIRKKVLDRYVANTTLRNEVVDRLPIALSLVNLDWTSILLWGLTPEKISARLFADPELDVENYQSSQIKKVVRRLESSKKFRLL